MFKKELNELDQNFDSNFVVTEDDPHPFILRLYLGGHISIETLCILLKLTKAKKHWDSKMQYDLIYDDVKLKIEKYTPFIKFDNDRIKKIVIDFFS